MIIKQLSVIDEKKKIIRFVLEALPDWFAVEESREEYINDSADRSTFVAYDGDKPAGFLCLKETGKETVELAVMGVLMEYHRQGIGRQLFDKAKTFAVEKGYEFIQVKTVKMGMYDDYDATNRFYQALGFKEFEVFPMLWDEANPCQIYVMGLK
jgi:ribosomal protein S18 acetylase RimI-like enzyme